MQWCHGVNKTWCKNMQLCHPWHSWWWPNLPSVLCQLHLTFDQNINVGGIYIFIVKDWKVLIAFLMRLLIFRLGHCGTISFPVEETSHCTLLDQTGDRGRFGWVGAKIQCIFSYIILLKWWSLKMFKKRFSLSLPFEHKGWPCLCPGRTLIEHLWSLLHRRTQPCVLQYLTVS